MHSQATKDPLTQVANRSEFYRVFDSFLAAHVERNMPCSLIIGDLDFFKTINDRFGHQAGDEAIKSFAALLTSFAHHGDLVARYGGEEFVLLCADCNAAAAHARAEQIRNALAELPQPTMGTERLTASFGCTENQPGDMPHTLLRRADRALLEAKDTGRNKTVQLGSGAPAPGGKKLWRGGTQGPPVQTTTEALLQTSLVSNVPMKILVEKLRGFIADHQAQIIATDEERIELAFGNETWLERLRRRGDRPISLDVAICFDPLIPEEVAPYRNLCGLQITIRTRRPRDRRLQRATERARQLVASMKSYLMAHERSLMENAAGVQSRRLNAEQSGSSKPKT